MERWFINPWAMVEDGVIWTVDEHDLLNPIKQFPNDPWLEWVAKDWLANPLFLLYKSRRMLLTWLMTFLHTHLAMFNEQAHIYFVSDKEEKADELVGRAAGIVDRIPKDSMLKPAYKYTYCYLEFPGLGSFIHGVPMGASQLRQYGCTAIFQDEAAFQEKARETYMASQPTIQGGGRYTAISSPQVSFFQDLVYDRVR